MMTMYVHGGSPQHVHQNMSTRVSPTQAVSLQSTLCMTSLGASIIFSTPKLHRVSHRIGVTVSTLVDLSPNLFQLYLAVCGFLLRAVWRNLIMKGNITLDAQELTMISRGAPIRKYTKGRGTAAFTVVQAVPPRPPQMVIIAFGSQTKSVRPAFSTKESSTLDVPMSIIQHLGALTTAITRAPGQHAQRSAASPHQRPQHGYQHQHQLLHQQQYQLLHQHQHQLLHRK